MNDLKILVVDDEQETAGYIASYLRRLLDCQITFAYCGAEAMLKLREDKYDLMILDLKMPGFNGFDVMRAAKSDDCMPKTVVITAWDSLQVLHESLGYGVEGYFAKPLDLESFGKKVKEILEK